MKYLLALIVLIVSVSVVSDASAQKQFVRGVYGEVDMSQNGNYSTWTTPDRAFGGWTTPTSEGSYSTYPGGNFRSYEVRPRYQYNSGPSRYGIYGAQSWSWDSPRWYWNR